MKILYQCILSILVYNLFLVKHCNISIYWYIGCLHDIEIQIFKNYDYLIGRKNRLDTKGSYNFSTKFWVNV